MGYVGADMDRNERAVDQIKKGIKEYVDRTIENAVGDKTVFGIVKEVIKNEKYNVLINGVLYYNLKTIGGTCKVNETVRVLIPQDNFNAMVILKGGGSGDLPENIVLHADEGEVQDLPRVDKGVRKLSELDDVSLGELNNDEALVYNSEAKMWINKKIESGGGGSNVKALGDLEDVSVGSASANDSLVYSGGTWISKNILTPIEEELDKIKEELDSIGADYRGLKIRVENLEKDVEYLKENMFDVQSVATLPSQTKRNTIYLIQGTVG